MNEDGKFWATIAATIATVVLTIVLSTQSFYKHHNNPITKMVQRGVSPIEAACALDDAMGNNPTCVIFATKSK